MAYIYGLRCECGCKKSGVRYVGQTVKTVQTRLVNHRSQARFGTATPVYHWMRKHGVENIQIIVLEEVDPDKLDEREVYWISGRKDQLLNISPGGGPETAFRGAKRPDISARMTGSSHPLSDLTEAQVLSAREEYRGGRGQVSELAKKYRVTGSTMSDILRGRTWKHVTGSHRAQGKSRVRLTEEDVLRIRSRRREGETLWGIAKDYNTSAANISNICTGKSWKHVI